MTSNTKYPNVVVVDHPLVQHKLTILRSTSTGSKQFRELVKELAMQIAAATPLYVSRDMVQQDVLEKERSIYRAQMEQSGKPANVIDLPAVAPAIACPVMVHCPGKDILTSHASFHKLRAALESREGAATLIGRALGETTSDAQRMARWAWARERFGWDALAARYAEMLRGCVNNELPVWSAG